MSAEQIAGQEADAGSVIFAFGTMLYEMAIWFAKHSTGRKGLKTDAI